MPPATKTSSDFRKKTWNHYRNITEMKIRAIITIKLRVRLPSFHIEAIICTFQNATSRLELLNSYFPVHQPWKNSSYKISPSITHSLGLYTDEVLDYLEKFGGSRVCLAGIAIQILLYVGDIVLISNSHGQQKHLNSLKVFCTDKGLSLNMDKTKVMVFNTTQAQVT